MPEAKQAILENINALSKRIGKVDEDVEYLAKAIRNVSLSYLLLTLAESIPQLLRGLPDR